MESGYFHFLLDNSVFIYQSCEYLKVNFEKNKKKLGQYHSQADNMEFESEPHLMCFMINYSSRYDESRLITPIFLFSLLVSLREVQIQLT